MMRKTPTAASGAVSAEGIKYCLDRMNPGVGRSHTLFLDHGKGSYVFDADNKKYLDFACGIGVTSLGHSHPRLVKAAQQQLEKAWHLQVSTGPHTALKRLLEGLETIFPKTLNNFSFVTTGAEAVEAAMKLARAATGRQGVVALQGAYHGRTVGASSMTSSKYVYTRNLKPLMPGVTIIPPPYWSQMALPRDFDTDRMIDMALEQADTLMHQTTHPSEIAMLIAEPILGEGGYVPLPKRYYKGLRELCTKHGILLAIDEVQAGFARTGTMFNFEQLAERDASGALVEASLPDIVVFAKGIANGLPIAGIVTRNELAAKQLPGQQGGTYAANCIACATAAEVIKVMADEGILDNVQARSKQLLNGLRKAVADHKLPVADIRGRGLMIGLQLDDTCAAGAAGKVADEALKNGLLMLNTSKYETVRVIPPLNVSESEMDEGLRIFTDAMRTTLPQSKRGSTQLKPCCEPGKQCNPAAGPCREYVA
jgi:4-aminobutyrate aminotransferase